MGGNDRDVKPRGLELGVRVRSGVARSTVPVQEELVAGCTESPWKPRFGLGDASFQVKDLPTRIAMEVVVMLFACELIAGGLSRNFYRDEPSVLDQGLDVPVNSRDSDSRVKLLRAL